MKKLFVPLLLLLFALYAFYPATLDTKVEFEGVVKENDKINIVNATATIYNSSANFTKDSKLTSVKTAANGKFKVSLEVNKYYLIEVSHPNYVTQLMSVNTNAPAPEIESGYTKTAIADFDMVRQIDGLNTALFASPVVKLKYSRSESGYEVDKTFEASIKSQFTQVKTQAAALLKKAYTAELAEGNTCSQQKKFDEALAHYTRAAFYMPDDKDVKKKIGDIEKQGVTIDKSYSTAMADGDKAIQAKDYSTAQDKFSKALVLKPGDVAAKSKLDDAKAKQTTAQTQQQTNTQIKTEPVATSLVFEFSVIVFNNASKVKDATVTLFLGNTRLTSILTNAAGLASFKLDLNKNYTIEIAKPGLLSQKINVNTTVPDEISKKSKWSSSLTTSVSLFEGAQGLNINLLNEPVRLVKYFPAKKDFDVDTQHKANMDNKLKELEQKAAELKSKPVANANNTTTESNKQIETVSNNPVEKDQKKNDDNKTNPSNNLTADNSNIGSTGVDAPVTKATRENAAQKIDSLLGVLKNSEQKGDKAELALVQSDLAEVYFVSGDHQNAIDYFQKALDNKQTLGDMDGVSTIEMNLGIVYFNTYRLDDAIAHFLKSLKVKESLSDKPGQSKLCYRIGNVYYEKRDLTKSIEYYEKALTFDKLMLDKKEEASSYNNLGVLNYELKNYEKAVGFYEKSMALNKELGRDKEVAISLNNLGNINYDWSKYNKALDYYQQSLQIKEKLDYKRGVALTLFNIANVFKQTKENAKALDYYGRSADISDKFKFEDILYAAYSMMAEIYNEQSNCNKSYELFKLASTLKSAVQGLNFKMQMSEMQVKYNTENVRQSEEISALKEEIYKQRFITQSLAMKKELELSVKNSEIEKMNSDLRIRSMQMYAFIIGFILVAILAFVIFRGYRQKQKANVLLAQQKKEIEIKNENLEYANNEIREKNEELYQQKEEIIAQRDEIEAQKDLIAQQRDLATLQRDQITIQKQEITDSITYAQNIQRALLIPDIAFLQTMPEHFVIYRPRDIVSGDFYWFARKGNSFIFSVADCTGHGVPGAFMSMLGITMLNEIISKMQDPIPGARINAGDILDQLREQIIKTLHQTGKDGGSKDGMDISMVVFNPDTYKIQYSGAFNSLYYISNGILIDIKADKMPIGIHIKEVEPFTNHEIQLKQGDLLYLFSDGYADQFGGEKGKKFSSKAMKELLQANWSKPLDQQKEALVKTHIEWRGSKDQIDDICIVGIKV